MELVEKFLEGLNGAGEFSMIASSSVVVAESYGKYFTAGKDY